MFNSTRPKTQQGPTNVIIATISGGREINSLKLVKWITIKGRRGCSCITLGAGALLVNPWNVIEVADAIGKALNMSDEERKI